AGAARSAAAQSSAHERDRRRPTWAIISRWGGRWLGGLALAAEDRRLFERTVGAGARRREDRDPGQVAGHADEDLRPVGAAGFALVRHVAVGDQHAGGAVVREEDGLHLLVQVQDRQAVVRDVGRELPPRAGHQLQLGPALQRAERALVRERDAEDERAGRAVLVVEVAAKV